nr:MAK10-like protein [Tanacetum cinerariifolium]
MDSRSSLSRLRYDAITKSLTSSLDGSRRLRALGLRRRLHVLTWTRFKELLQKVPHHGIDIWLQVQCLMKAHLAPTQPTQVNKITTSCKICSGPHDTQYCMEDLEQAFVEYASPRTDEAKDAKLTKFEADCKQQQSEMTNKIDTVLKAITDRIAEALPSDTVKNSKLSTYPVLSTRSYPIEDPQCSTHVHVNKITTSCEICSGPHDTQYCMEDLDQAFVEYASPRTDEAKDAKLTKFEADCKQQQSEMTNKIDTLLKAITDRIAEALPSDTVKNSKLSTYPVFQTNLKNDEPEEEEEKENPKNIHANPPTPPDASVSFITKKVLKLNSIFESLGLVPQSSHTELVCTKGDDDDVMFVEIVRKNNDSRKEEPKAGEQEVEYFDVLPTRSELAYPKYLMCGPVPLIFLRNPIITEGCPSTLKIPCNIRHVHAERAYIDLNSPLNIMTRMMYNWIMRRKLDPRENSNQGISNFTGRIKGTHVFVGNFTYITDFMIAKDISSIIDPRLSQVVLGRPFIEISNMTRDPSEGVVRFTNGNDEVAYKMPHKIEQYNSLSNLEKEHTKSVYLRNKEDKRRGVEYVMSKIFGFYTECLELGPEYLIGMDDEG